MAADKPFADELAPLFDRGLEKPFPRAMMQERTSIRRRRSWQDTIDSVQAELAVAVDPVGLIEGGVGGGEQTQQAGS